MEEEQNKIIKEGLKHNIDLYSFAKAGYTAPQLKEILLGYLQNIDINKFLHRNYSSELMCEIRTKNLENKNKKGEI